MNYAIIPLSGQGKYEAIVDADSPALIYKWSTSVVKLKSGRIKVYACRWVKRKKIYLHRFLTDAPKGTFVDHKNQEPLDNRLANLRFATRSQNAANGVRKSPKSGYRGVLKRGNRYEVIIRKNRKGVYVGYFPTAMQAAMRYDEVAKKLHGEFAVLNFE